MLADGLTALRLAGDVFALDLAQGLDFPTIDRRFISWGAAGWHICFDVLERLLAGEPMGRIAGPETMKSGGWQRLSAEYATQFGVETPGWPRRARVQVRPSELK